MKISSVLLAISVAAFTFSSCKKEKPEENPPSGGGGPTPLTSNYYIFEGDTFIAGNANYGFSKSSPTFKFYCSNVSGGGGDKQVDLHFRYSGPGQPAAGTYPVIAFSWPVSDSTTSAIVVRNTDSTYFNSTGGGVITVGKSGTKTTYDFANIPLQGGKTIKGNFIW